MLKKAFTAEIKALTPTEGATQPGQFEAVVAVFDNVDRHGDRVKAGAFDETLEAWRKSGDPIPIILAHQWDDPWKHIGYAMPEDVKSIPGRGLYVEKGILDIEDNPLARQVYRLMERRTLKEFSFGYTVPAGGERKAADGAFDLTNLHLIEFGPCLKGVNEETELLAIKSELDAERARERGEELTLEQRITRIEAHIGKAVLLGETKADEPEDEEKEETEEEAPEVEATPVDEADPEAEASEPEPEETPEEPEADAEDEPEDEKASDPAKKSEEINLMLHNQAIANFEAQLPDVFGVEDAPEPEVKADPAEALAKAEEELAPPAPIDIGEIRLKQVTDMLDTTEAAHQDVYGVDQSLDDAARELARREKELGL